MEPRIYHGDLTPDDFAQRLAAEFSRGNLRTQILGSDDMIAVQIATLERPASGGQTALTITLQKVPDGVAVQVGQQNWLGLAASLGQTAMSAWRNPWNLLNRLDDVAQDLSNIMLAEQTWRVIDRAARSAGASFELSERLKRLECEYCGVANPVDTASCITCGAPMGGKQPDTCHQCGFVLKTDETVCPNCGRTN